MKSSLVIKLVAVSLLAGVLLPMFGMAQTGTLPSSSTVPKTGTLPVSSVGTQPSQNTNTTFPVPDMIPGLNTDGWNKAQDDKNYCLGEFKNGISYYSNNVLKTVYDSNVHAVPRLLGSTIQRCFIVLATAPDDLFTGGAGVANISSYRPIGAQALETTIQESPRGISKQSVQDSANQAANEQVNASGASQLIGSILINIFNVVGAVLLNVTAIAGTVFDNTVYPILHQTAMPAIVTIGWTIVRDLCNMFFILILIVIGLGAILRIEAYDYRHLLPELILMAILVNFSQVIAVTIMNFVNLFAAMFWNGIGLGQIYSTLIKIINPMNDLGTIQQGGTLGSLALGIGKLAYIVVLCGTFLILAGMFVIRLVGLYVLIIFSPIAYVADILPATKNYAHEWWHKFIHYLLWAPVALFMLRLTFLIINANGSNLVVGADSSHSSSFTFIILTGFLIAAVLVAEHAGMVGGEYIVKAGEALTHHAMAYVARGEPIAHLGAAVTKATGWHGLENIGHKVTGFTAGVEAVPGAVKDVFARSEKKRANEVQDKSIRMQEKIGALEDFDKDTVGQIPSKFIHELARKGKLNANRVRNIYEHGSRKQKEALRLALKDGHFNANTPENEAMRKMIADEDQKMNGVNPQNRLGWQAYQNALGVEQTGTLKPGETWAQVENDASRYDNRRAYVRPGTYGGPQDQQREQQQREQQRPPVINYTPPSQSSSSNGNGPRNYPPPPPVPPRRGRVVVEGGGSYNETDYTSLNININHNHYDVLGVSKNATATDITSAYRRRSRETHPDVNNGNDEEFKKVSAAYQILNDPAKRTRYDQIFP